MPIASDFDTFTWRYYKNGGGKIDVSLDIAIKYILDSFPADSDQKKCAQKVI